jgi:predicted secreted hydrolase
MGTYVGRQAKVHINDTLVANLAEYTITSTAETIRGGVFGDTYERVHGTGLIGWSGNVSGYLDHTDSTGQDVLHLACVSGTKVTNFKLYVNDTDYYYPDTVAFADAGVYISSEEISASQGDVTRVSFAFQGTGPLGKHTA